jgi:hypothetical protein
MNEFFVLNFKNVSPANSCANEGSFQRNNILLALVRFNNLIGI